MSRAAASESAPPAQDATSAKNNSAEWKVLKTLNKTAFECVDLYSKVIGDFAGPDSAKRLAETCDGFAKQGRGIQDIKKGIEDVERALAGQTKVIDETNGAAERIRLIHATLKAVLDDVQKIKT
jgi:hypothetical protein